MTQDPSACVFEQLVLLTLDTLHICSRVGYEECVEGSEVAIVIDNCMMSGLGQSSTGAAIDTYLELLHISLLL